MSDLSLAGIVALLGDAIKIAVIDKQKREDRVIECAPLFHELDNVLSSVVFTGKCSQDKQNKLRETYDSLKILLPQKTINLYTKVNKLISSLACYQEEFSSLPVGKERSFYVKKASSVKLELEGIHSGLTCRFRRSFGLF